MADTHKKHNFAKASVLLASAILTVACQHDLENTTDEKNLLINNNFAVISTRASDYSSGDFTLIKFEDYYSKEHNAPTGSDNVIYTNKDDIYQIGRYGLNNISKYNIASTETNIWQYSTDDAVENADTSSNPYKIVFANDQKAYIIRYGSDKVWIVNPEAGNIADFRLGEISLSDYADTETSPEPADALIVDDKLYVIMQRLDKSGGYIPGDAYLAVFNTTDDSEVETNTDSSTPKGIALKLKNPNHLEFLSSNNSLYISAIGRYERSWANPPTDAEYTGGIESVNLADYSTQVVVDDGDATDAPYGNITNVTILNSTRGYFVGYNSFGDNNLYTFNPSDGVVEENALISNKDLADIEIGPLGDLWVANATDSGIIIIDTVNNTVKESHISTELVPMNIEFVTLKSL